MFYILLTDTDGVPRLLEKGFETDLRARAAAMALCAENGRSVFVVQAVCAVNMKPVVTELG